MESNPRREPEPPAALRDLMQQTHDLRRRAEELQVEIAKIRESVTSDDRRVTVTVGAGGVMQSIRVEPAGNSGTATQLVASVMKAYGVACRRVGERSADLVALHVPGSPVAEMMREAIPPDPEDDATDEWRTR